MNDGLKNAIASLKASLLKPDPDLDAGQTKDMQTRLDYLQELLASKESSGESARWLPCGLCHGRAVAYDAHADHVRCLSHARVDLAWHY